MCTGALSWVMQTNPHVRDWVCGRLQFLTSQSPLRASCAKGVLRSREREWGESILGRTTPNRVPWTGPFGETLVRDVLLSKGQNVRSPSFHRSYKLDWETDDMLIEVKTGAYFSQGSAHEKVLAVPFKYIDVPQVYGKPLWIVCVGKTELVSRTVFGNVLGPRTTDAKRALLESYASYGIRFVCASSLL